MVECGLGTQKFVGAEKKRRSRQKDDGWRNDGADGVEGKRNCAADECEVEQGHKQLADHQADKIAVDRIARNQYAEQKHTQGQTDDGGEKGEIHSPETV